MKPVAVFAAFFAALLLTLPGLGGAGKGTAVTLGTLKSTTPADWKNQPPSSKLRLYQFAVGDADLAIFHFPGGGSPEENIARWKGQFQPPEGKTIDQVSKVEKFKVASADVTCLDIHGTYLSKNPPQDPNAKTERKANYRSFAVYFACEGGPYFIRLTGPAKTLEQHKKSFDDWLKNFK
jgi:hypothetical protein